MNSSFLGMAVSRKDGSDADGIHLLWTAPYTAGYSVEGFDIQRRLSIYKPKVDCYTLTAPDLEVLHREYRVKTPLAEVGLRQAPCPDFPHDPPDEPYKDIEQPPGANQSCVDFQSFPRATGANPRTEKGVRFLVRDHNGVVRPQTSIAAIAGFKGLDCGATLEINLPLGVSEVELTLVHFSSPGQIEAFNVDGSSAGTASMTNQQHLAQTFKLRSTAINRVVVRAPQTETLLLSFCFAARPTRCIDYQSYPVGLANNPRNERGLLFEVRGSTGCMSLPFASQGEVIRPSLLMGIVINLTL